MKTKILLVIALLSVLFLSCEGGSEPSNSYDGENNTEHGMYLGITAFSNDVKYYGSKIDRFHVLTKSNVSTYTSFVNSLSMGDATVLYYAVDNNLSYLQNCKFPDDLSSVNIVTFTDGLNQGSRALDKQEGEHDYAANDKSYIAEINRKIKNTKVQGLPINAYAIGIRGKDVSGDAITIFQDNLQKLSSSKENAMEVTNMKEVNTKFREIASSLYSKSETTTLTITIPMPSENEKERFTFDDVTDATKSKCYLEGVYANGALNNINYVGCGSNSGIVVKEKSAGGVKIKFEFEDFSDNKGKAISTTNMQQWHMEQGQTTWTRNSEFRPNESIETIEEHKTAVVMLVLDCSSSLGNDFENVKSAANDFIKTLVGEAVNTNPGGGTGNSEEAKAKVRLKFGGGNTHGDNFQFGLWSETLNKLVCSKSFSISAATSQYFDVTIHEGETFSCWCSDERGEYNGNNGFVLENDHKYTLYLFGYTYELHDETGKGEMELAKIRFCKEYAYTNVAEMGLVDEDGDFWVGGYWFGEESGTTSYYDIPAATLSPVYFYNYITDNENNSGWYYALDKHTYTFESGKSYTYTCGDDGEYLVFTITLDGSFNAPAKRQIVAQRRVHKSKMASSRSNFSSTFKHSALMRMQ
ncbi:MAG: hypothetical protein IJQ06_09185 [Paludibacteraceae bacterium]|nr:hypothetical protein [Paludibacteraceae bacterium]